ncbi:hypothetical protein AX17_006934, partial [Amanita inopinata Kibby_2008]
VKVRNIDTNFIAANARKILETTPVNYLKPVPSLRPTVMLVLSPLSSPSFTLTIRNIGSLSKGWLSVPGRASGWT